MSETKSKKVSKTKKNKTSGRLVARKKKITLSQRVKEQALQIEQLNALLQQRERALVETIKQCGLIDELTQKLDETKKSSHAAQQLVSEYAKKLDTLNAQARDKELITVNNAAEQAELIDELTVKLLDVDIKLAAASLQNQHTVAQNIVKTHMIAGMSLGLIPAPLFDVAALTGTQLNMLRTLSKHYDVDFDEQKSKALLTSLLSGSLPVMTILSLSSVVKLIPGIGTVAGGFGMILLAGTIIHATGKVFIRHFDVGGTLEDFDSKYWQAYFKQEVEESKLVVKDFLNKQKLQKPIPASAHE